MKFSRSVACAVRGVALAALALLVGLAPLATPASVAAHHGGPTPGNQGLQGGWAIDDGGNPVFYHSAATQFPIMKDAGAGWVRINFRLGACYKDWTSVGCNGLTAIQQYTRVVSDARAQGLNVLGLLSNESWHGSQSQWTASNAETTRGSGDNAYVKSFSQKAASTLASHFNGSSSGRPLVAHWEIWNEPNAWTYRDSRGEPAGGTYLYPSNFAWLLKRSYDAIRSANGSAVVISGGVFAHGPVGVTATMYVDGNYQRVTRRGELAGAARSAFGQARAQRDAERGQSPAPTSPTTPSPRSGPNATQSQPDGQPDGQPEHDTMTAGAVGSTKCADSVFTDGSDSGHDYLCFTYQMGFSKAKWGTTAPFHHVGQHFYIDESGPTSETNIARYLNDLRASYTAYEGTGTAKRTHITEFGWRTEPGYVTDDVQAANLQTAFQTFARLGYVGRGYWFTVQDVPEGNVYFGIARGDYVHGDATSVKPAFAAYQTYAR